MTELKLSVHWLGIEPQPPVWHNMNYWGGQPVSATECITASNVLLGGYLIEKILWFKLGYTIWYFIHFLPHLITTIFNTFYIPVYIHQSRKSTGASI